MTIYVLVPMVDGIVRDVAVYLDRHAAAKAERDWLTVQGIDTENVRLHRSDWGTGIAIWDCEPDG